jgi:hypothetical protein
MKENFVNQLIISIFHIILTTTHNLCDIVKTTYILEQMEYHNIYENHLFRLQQIKKIFHMGDFE